MFKAAAKKHKSLTINGIHLSEEGDKLLAQAILPSFTGGQTFAGKAEVKAQDDEKLRAAVNEKNVQWEQRYRTIDGSSIYGGRSVLATPLRKT